jgi:hypothetical protein
MKEIQRTPFCPIAHTIRKINISFKWFLTSTRLQNGSVGVLEWDWDECEWIQERMV